MTLGFEVGDVGDLGAALREHRVVVVRSPDLPLRDQVDLTAHLGRVIGSAPGVPQVRYEDERRHSDHAFFNEQWHADLSWCAEGPAITVLFGLTIGRRAAPTAFVDTVSGFAALPEPVRQQATDRKAHHHVTKSRQVRYGKEPAPAPRFRRRRPMASPGHGAASPTYVEEPGATHPIVVTDPGSERPGVLLGDHAWSIDGLEPDEGSAFIDDVQSRVVAAAERYVHTWRPGDLIAFDNRTVLHRREPIARHGRRRVLRRTVAWPAS